MFQNETNSYRLSKPFQWLTVSVLTLNLIACAESKTGNVAARRHTGDQFRQVNPSDLLQRATETKGSNAAGYAALGLVSLKSLNRAIDVALNHSNAGRLETCQTQKLKVEKVNDTTTTVTIVTDPQWCAGSSGNESLTVVTTDDKSAAQSSATKVGLQSISKADSELDIAGKGAKDQPELTLVENYTITRTSGAQYKFDYHGEIDYTATKTIATPHLRRQADPKAPAVVGNKTPPTPPAPAPAPVTNIIKNATTVVASGTFDLTKVQAPKIVLSSLSVDVTFGQGVSGKEISPLFTSNLKTMGPSSSLPLVCGVPTGALAFQQTFIDLSNGGSKQGVFHPSVNFQNSRVGDMDPLAGCDKLKGLAEIEELVAKATHYMVSGQSTQIQRAALDPSTNETAKAAEELTTPQP